MAPITLLALLVGASHWPAEGSSNLALLGVPVAIVVLLILAWGLVSEAAWSVPLAILWLCGLVLLGSIDVVVALWHGQIQIPLGAIAALLILSQRPRGGARPVLQGRDRRTPALLIGAYVAATLWPYAVCYLAVPGSWPE